MTPPARQPCARPGCGRLAREYDGRGRPPLYCSTRCQQTVANTRTRPALTIEITHPPLPAGQRPAGRVFTIKLRRGNTTVTVAADRGHTSAQAIADQLAQLLDAPVTTTGAAID